MKIVLTGFILVSLWQGFLLFRAAPRTSPAPVVATAVESQVTAGNSPAAPAVEDPWREELVAIRQELRAARAETAAPSPGADPPQAMAGDAGVAQAVVPMDERFESQIKDDAWHDAAENLLIDSLFALESDAYLLYHADCRQSMCRMEIAVENLSAAATDELAALAPWPAYTRLRIDAEAVPPRAVLYVAREGFDFHGQARFEEEKQEP